MYWLIFYCWYLELLCNEVIKRKVEWLGYWIFVNVSYMWWVNKIDVVGKEVIYGYYNIVVEYMWRFKNLENVI